MKIDLRTNLAYGIGQAGDTIPYCMFYTFFLYFLTDNVGLSPMLAGTISLIAVCWDGITDPIVGYLSDHTRCRYGRRRPWLIASIFPLGIVVFLIFAPFGNSPVYFLLMAMLFWTLYTSYVIPYMSLGSELTTDYNGRNYVRMFNMIVGGLFMLLCTSGPSAVQAWGIEHGFSDRGAWGISGGIFGLLTIICGLICWMATRGKENTDLVEETEKAKQKGEEFHFPYITLHKLRHLNISALLAHGAYLTDVRDNAGHSDIQTTMHYTHNYIEGKKEIANKIDEIYSPLLQIV